MTHVIYLLLLVAVTGAAARMGYKLAKTKAILIDKRRETIALSKIISGLKKAVEHDKKLSYFIERANSATSIDELDKLYDEIVRPLPDRNT